MIQASLGYYSTRRLHLAFLLQEVLMHLSTPVLIISVTLHVTLLSTELLYSGAGVLYSGAVYRYVRTIRTVRTAIGSLHYVCTLPIIMRASFLCGHVLHLDDAVL
jgi:hypothetical protein